MITVNLLRKAYDAGVVKLVTDPDLEHGTVCQIGEHWFYFAGFSGESCPPEKYAEVTPEEDILREIMETLDFFREDRAFRTEYSYYDAVLNGWEKKKGKKLFHHRVRTVFCKLFRLQSDGSILEKNFHRVPTDAMIKELIRREASLDSCSIHSLLLNSGFFAHKLWAKNDVKDVLKNNGYAQSETNVGLVLDTGLMRDLSDCTDSDWHIIENAIDYCSSDLEKAPEIEVLEDIDLDTLQDSQVALILSKALIQYCNKQTCIDDGSCYCCPISEEYNQLFDDIGQKDTPEYKERLKKFFAECEKQPE